MNGHNWLATKLAKRKIPYVLRENAFLSIDNFAKAQELSDSIKEKFNPGIHSNTSFSDIWHRCALFSSAYSESQLPAY